MVIQFSIFHLHCLRILHRCYHLHHIFVIAHCIPTTTSSLLNHSLTPCTTFSTHSFLCLFLVSVCPFKYSSYTQHSDFPRVSPAIRAEFARGDGRIKRKEDDRRKNIQPNETLFVVNFSEETTKREDLEMLFSKFGELVRIDMKKNYAFVQFTNVDDATRARNATNGGKLDQNVITVECEYVTT